MCQRFMLNSKDTAVLVPTHSRVQWWVVLEMAESGSMAHLPNYQQCESLIFASSLLERGTRTDAVSLRNMATESSAIYLGDC